MKGERGKERLAVIKRGKNMHTTKTIYFNKNIKNKKLV